MARKRHAPSQPPPPPPPPPPQDESSSADSSSGEEEEEAQRTSAPQKPPKNPKSPSTAAANDDDDDADLSKGGDEEQGAEESSDSQIDAEAFQLRQVARSSRKPSAAASKLESDADEEEEEGEPSDDPEPVQKKAAKKPKADAGKKRPAPEPTPFGKAKKGKFDDEKAAPEPSPSAKVKKATSRAEKTAPELNLPSGRAKKPNAALDPSPSRKSEKPKRWTTNDEIMILEALIGHAEPNGVQPSAGDLVAAIGDSLERKDCSKSEMYEKVRNLKQRYENTATKVASTGALPGKGDELHIYKLSEAIWGENAKGGTSSKSKKGQTNKEKMVVHSKGGTTKEVSTTTNENVGVQTHRKKGQATKEKVDGDTKSRATTTDIPDGEGLRPKETTVATQNGGILTEKENGGSQEGMDIDADVQGIGKGFNELQNLYPNLTSYVERIKAQHPCGETLMRAFQFIDDQKASALESKIKKQRKAEVKTEIRRADTKKDVAHILMRLLE